VRIGDIGKRVLPIVRTAFLQQANVDLQLPSDSNKLLIPTDLGKPLVLDNLVQLDGKSMSAGSGYPIKNAADK
jgi:hypothetical protein